jgi:hypothetical protein
MTLDHKIFFSLFSPDLAIVRLAFLALIWQEVSTHFPVLTMQPVSTQTLPTSPTFFTSIRYNVVTVSEVLNSTQHKQIYFQAMQDLPRPDNSPSTTFNGNLSGRGDEASRTLQTTSAGDQELLAGFHWGCSNVGPEYLKYLYTLQEMPGQIPMSLVRKPFTYTSPADKA